MSFVSSQAVCLKIIIIVFQEELNILREHISNISNFSLWWPSPLNFKKLYNGPITAKDLPEHLIQVMIVTFSFFLFHFVLLFDCDIYLYGAPCNKWCCELAVTCIVGMLIECPGGSSLPKVVGSGDSSKQKCLRSSYIESKQHLVVWYFSVFMS